MSVRTPARPRERRRCSLTVRGAHMNKRPRVLLFALGGTISAAPDEVGYSFPARAATDLLSSVPDAAAIANVTGADVKQVPSRAVTPTDMCALAHEVRNRVA